MIKWKRLKGSTLESQDGQFKIIATLDDRNAPLFYHLYIGKKRMNDIYLTKTSAKKYAEGLKNA